MQTHADLEACGKLENHGIPVYAAQQRGYTAALDGQGRRIALVWLNNGVVSDPGGGTRSILAIDAETGQTRRIPVTPFAGDTAFGVYHSERERLYAAYGGHFYEFDPVRMRFSFGGRMPERFAMSWFEDRSGIVWAALWPNTNLLEFDPESRRLTDHGEMNSETWNQYPRHIVADRTGWLYLGIGDTLGQVIGFNPVTGERRAYVPPEHRSQGSGQVYAGSDGQIYAIAPGLQPSILMEGKAHPLKECAANDFNQLKKLLARQNPPASIDWSRVGKLRACLKDRWPDGSRLRELDLELRRLSVTDADGVDRQVPFDYEAMAVNISVLCAGPDNKIYGSTHHPAHLFIYDPVNDDMRFYPKNGLSFTSLRSQDRYVFGGQYSGGIFWVLDTERPLSLTAAQSVTAGPVAVRLPPEGIEQNPRRIGKPFDPNVNLPRSAFAHPDGKHIMISGQPGYGWVGGGIVIYDLETEAITELTHKELVPDSSTMAITALPNGDLLCGASPEGGHGTNPVHDRAMLYILDWNTRKVIWKSDPLRMATLENIAIGSDGLYYCMGGDSLKRNEPAPDGQYGFVGGEGVLAVFDAARREIVHYADLSKHGKYTSNQAMLAGPDGKIYLALTIALLRIHPLNFKIETLAIPEGGIQAGLGIVGKRVYFASRGHLMSVGI